VWSSIRPVATSSGSERPRLGTAQSSDGSPDPYLTFWWTQRSSAADASRAVQPFMLVAAASF
jgi:hypothetical protein